MPDAGGCVRARARACVRVSVRASACSRHHRALALAAAGRGCRDALGVSGGGSTDADGTRELMPQFVLDITTPRASWWNPFYSSSEYK